LYKLTDARLKLRVSSGGGLMSCILPKWSRSRTLYSLSVAMGAMGVAGLLGLLCFDSFARSSFGSCWPSVGQCGRVFSAMAVQGQTTSTPRDRIPDSCDHRSTWA